MMAKVLVTGANGFIGRELCRHLKGAGHFVRATVRTSGAAIGVLSDHVVEIGDIGSNTDWSRALNGIDVVVHLAARAHVMKEGSADPLAEFRRVNVDGTRSLASACIDARIKRFVLLSSIGVNGESTVGRPFTESDVPSPATPYAVSKWEAERVLVDVASASGLQYTIIRSPLVYGPNVPGNFLRLMSLVNLGVPLPFAVVRNSKSLISLGNLADAIMTCIEHANAANQLFLVSDDEDISTPELIRRLSVAMGKTPRLFYMPEKWIRGCMQTIGKGEMVDKLCGSLQVDSGKLRRVLGWSPPFSVAQGVHSAAQWYLERRSISHHL